MTQRLSESSWKPPSVDRILFNFDRIYASGIFWRVVSPQLLESQSRLMSAIALMAEKLKATLPHDQPPPEGRHRRHAPRFNCQNPSLIYLTDSLRHPNRHQRKATHLSRDTNVNYASTRRRSNGLRRDRLLILSLQLRISPLCTTSWSRA